MKLFDVYPLYPITPVSAKGSWIQASDGAQYLDLYGGHAVISIGHSHPHYLSRLQEQMNKISFYSNAVLIPQQEELAAKLGLVSGYGDYALFLSNSGAEANENALKMASFHTGRKKIISFKKSFHGRTSLAVAATDNPSLSAPVNRMEGIVFLPLNDEPAFLEAMNDEVCAVIVEGIQGVGGVEAPDDHFLRLVKKSCEQHGSILILDEVQSGYGRSGKFFAHQRSGIKPDIITVAKGMGNGFPVAGTLLSPEFRASYGMLGTTFGGNYLACAAALAVLEVLEGENLMQHAGEMGDYLMENLRGFPGIKKLRGRGLMLGIELFENSAATRKKLLFDHGIFTGSSSDANTLRILPALNIQQEELDIFLEAFYKELKSLSHEAVL
jgi:acetylornithine/N-succinyldiaminopimelate aminotransferase